MEAARRSASKRRYCTSGAVAMNITPPLTPLPTKLILPLVSSPSLLATRQTFILCFARRERERDCPPNHHGSFSPSFVSPMFEWVPLYSWLPSTWDDGNFSPPLCSQFSRMIARGLKGSLEVGVFFYLLFQDER